MANILLITSGPRGSESYSNRIADTVIRGPAQQRS